MKLNEIRDNKGAHKRRMRVGRGIGSGKGKTCGRGVKGQKSRSGVSIKGFEGGQMPLHMRLPKQGFTNIFRKRYALLNVGRLQAAIDAGKLDPGKEIDSTALVSSGVIRRCFDGVRLLAKGQLTSQVKIKVVAASRAALAAVEKAGGSVTILSPSPVGQAEAPSSSSADQDR